MNKRTLIVITALTLGMSTINLWAQQDDGAPPPPPPSENGNQTDGPPHGRHRPPPRSPLVDALDPNHNGIIDSNAIAHASELLLKLDKRHTGQLTPDEYMPPHPRSPLLDALDTNHDGIIDSNEIAHATESLLKLDKNHTGQLTRDEYMPAPPHGSRDSGGQGPDSKQRPPGPPPEDN